MQIAGYFNTIELGDSNAFWELQSCFTQEVYLNRALQGKPAPPINLIPSLLDPNRCEQNAQKVLELKSKYPKIDFIKLGIFNYPCANSDFNVHGVPWHIGIYFSYEQETFLSPTLSMAHRVLLQQIPLEQKLFWVKGSLNASLKFCSLRIIMPLRNPESLTHQILTGHFGDIKSFYKNTTYETSFQSIYFLPRNKNAEKYWTDLNFNLAQREIDSLWPNVGSDSQNLNKNTSYQLINLFFPSNPIFYKNS